MPVLNMVTVGLTSQKMTSVYCKVTFNKFLLQS